jgi:hypothetical protein
MGPTGERSGVSAVNIDRVVEGRIVEHGGTAKLLGPLLEIGAIQVVIGSKRLSCPSRILASAAGASSRFNGSTSVGLGLHE